MRFHSRFNTLDYGGQSAFGIEHNHEGALPLLVRRDRSQGAALIGGLVGVMLE
jgi:hypothetical protein